MRSRSIVSCILSLWMISMASGCSKSDAPATGGAPASPAAPAPWALTSVAEGKKLFDQKCGVCHDLARAADRKETRDGWVAIVKNMQGKKAGWISDADALKILDFLVAEHGRK